MTFLAIAPLGAATDLGCAPGPGAEDPNWTSPGADAAGGPVVDSGPVVNGGDGATTVGADAGADTGADGSAGTGGGNDASARGGGLDSSSGRGEAGAAATKDSGSYDGTTESGGGPAPQSDGGGTVCDRWTADRMDLSEGTWTGSIANCDPGAIGGNGLANALKLVNLYRFLTGMPAVVDDPMWDSEAQQCALIQSANALNHYPASTAMCYTTAGSDGSARSDLSSGPGVGAIDRYMADTLDGMNMGHRRWILNNQLGPVGFGSAVASCFMNTGGMGNAGKDFVAWPPPGEVPYGAIQTTQLDQGGWTIQSDTINVSSGTVTVLDGTQMVAVTSNSLPAGYGSQYAVRFVPSGWSTQAGHSYSVSVSGTPVSYTVQVVTCP